ncbi:thermonuclease family protein [Verrucomicrobiota bacterium]
MTRPRLHIARKALILLLFPAGVFTGVVVTRHGFQAGEIDPFTARCAEVVDGDTIKVEWQGNTETVRLIGIDCAETRNTPKLRKQSRDHGISPESVMQLGRHAKSTTTRQVLDKRVRLVFPDDEVRRDSFGRLLCYVEAGGADLGQRLLTSGYAYLYPAEHPRQVAYEAAVAEARRRRSGIWRGVPGVELRRLPVPTTEEK